MAVFKPAFVAPFETPPGSALRLALSDALRTASEADSELLIDMLTDGSGSQLGVTSFRLESILATVGRCRSATASRPRPVSSTARSPPSRRCARWTRR